MDREQKQKQGRQNVARARMIFQRNLAWTYGFPEAFIAARDDSQRVSWVRLSRLADSADSCQFSIDREVLRQSELASSKLRNQYPKAIRRIFSDPDQWFGRFEDLLRRLKKIIHDNESVESLAGMLPPLGQPLAAKLASANPGLQSIARGCLFAEGLALQPSLGDLKKWLIDALDPLAQLKSGGSESIQATGSQLSDIQLQCLQLISLRDVLSPSEAASIVRLLTSSGIRTVHYPQPNEPMCCESNQAKRLITEASSEDQTLERLAPPNRKTILDLVSKILRQMFSLTPQSKKVFVELLVALGNSELVALLDKAGDAAQAEERRLRGLYEQVSLLRSDPDTRLSQTSKLPKNVAYPLSAQTVARELPQEDCRLFTVVGNLLSQAGNGKLNQRLLRAYAKWLHLSGSEISAGLEIAKNLQVKLREKSPPRAQDQIANILEELCRTGYATGNGSKLVRLIARTITEEKYHVGLLFDPWIVDYWSPTEPLEATQADLKQLNILIAKLVQSPETPNSPVVIDSLGAISRTTPDTFAALELVFALEEDPPEFAIDCEEIEALRPFSEGTSDLAKMLKSLSSSSIDSDNVLAVQSLSQEALGKKLVRSWIESDKNDSIERLKQLLRRVSFSAEMATEITPHESTWVKDYPAGLQDVLVDLASVAGDAHEIAKTVLRYDFPDLTALSRELAYLEQRLKSEDLHANEADNLRMRCNNIRKHLQSDRSISADRLNTLKEKLQNRALLEYERQLNDQLVSQFIQQLPQEAQNVARKRWQDKPIQSILLGLPELNKQERSVGYHLLSLHDQGVPFAELDHRENKEFLANLDSQGINTEPWMDSSRRTLIQKEDQELGTLAFATDPLDYLLMGHFFKTCLSPDSFNFFSTIANAVDVNKRVLYGRDADGKVLGRCLVALGARGELVQFNAYSHDHHEEFNLAVDQHLALLARDMKSQRSHTAKVPRLVAGRWYDDGAVAIDGSVGASYLAQLEDYIKGEVPSTAPARDEIDNLKKLIDQCLLDYGFQEVLWCLRERTYDFTGLAPKWILELLFSRMAAAEIAHEHYVAFAEHCFLAEHPDLMHASMAHYGEKRLLRLFKRSICDSEGCYAFHPIGRDEFVEAMFTRINASMGLRMMRASRKRFVRADKEEVSQTRRRILAGLHERLGRQQLAAELRQRPQRQTAG